LVGIIDVNSQNNTNEQNLTQKISNSLNTGSFFDNLIGDDTQIQVKNDKDPKISLDNFIGCANIKKNIKKLILQINYETIYKTNNCELPKGLLLLGPPGVGKTHLVKTIINSTGMNYIFISGSDFNKKYVGSGSSTVDKLFKKARENKPCLIFIDEADTILKKRSHSDSSAATTDFNSTICKFLAEMDSLKTESGVVLIFASNMDITHIDKGIMRAGRIDQIININLPTFEERIKLFKMYLGDLYDSDIININKISKLSYGLTGSDIKKIINLIKIDKIYNYVEANECELTDYKGLEYGLFVESMIYPTKTKYKTYFKTNKISNNETDEISNNETDEISNDDNDNDDDVSNGDNDDVSNGVNDDISNGDNNKSKINVKIIITTDDIDKEISKCILGMERDRKVNEMNKKIIAYHEAGHALLGFLIKDSIIPTKICISINSKSLGYTMFPQDDDDLLMRTTISQLLIEVMILYGGRMSEKLFIGDITCGAEDDYSRARKILKRLLMNGMLVSENNYVDFENNEQKLTEHMEMQLKNINKIIINEIESLFNKYSNLVHEISKSIIEFGSITSDDIYEIFKSENLSNVISSYDISIITNKINEKLNEDLNKN
jgi:ATP-dependent Zn protease